MLQIVVDDSGHRSGPLFSLGALVAPVENWLRLTREWSEELSVEPSVKYFKMCEAVRCEGEFSTHASRPELVRHRIDNLAAITQKYVQYAIESVMSLDHYNSLVKPLLSQFEKAGRRFRGISSPYFYLAFSLIRWTDIFGEEISYVFDEQSGEGTLVQEWWPEMARTFNESGPPHRVPSRPDYRADQTFVPLQVADAFAWLQNRSYSTDLQPTIVQPPTVDEFLGRIPLVRRTFDEKQFTAVVDVIEAFVTDAVESMGDE